jgi:hypothetical protein
VGDAYYRPIFRGGYVEYVRADPFAPSAPRRESLPPPITQ